MPYPKTSPEDVTRFERHGFLVVEDAIPPEDLETLARRAHEILERKREVAFDWAWEKGTPREERPFRIVQAGPTRLFPELAKQRFRLWAAEFASALLRRPCEFWYDQLLGKPPREGAPTLWHQDEGYWGRNLDERGVTCWLPLQDVDPLNGCMHFIDGGHRDGVLPHFQPPHLQSDLLTCEVDAGRQVACPLGLGGVTFHHGKTPHMTPANQSDAWRLALSQHFKVEGSKGEGDHYPWKVYVNQFTGEVVKPRTR